MFLRLIDILEIPGDSEIIDSKATISVASIA